MQYNLPVQMQFISRQCALIPKPIEALEKQDLSEKLLTWIRTDVDKNYEIFMENRAAS